VAALVATSPANVFYLTGFTGLCQRLYRHLPVFAVYGRGGTALVVPGIEAATVVSEPVEVDVVRTYGGFVYARGENPGEVGGRILDLAARDVTAPDEALAAALDEVGAREGAVGLDESHLTPPSWERAVERLRPRRVVPAAALWQAARRVKGPWEIECLDRALRITEEAVNAVIQALKPGVTEREAAALYEQELARRGAQPFCSTILFGERAAFPAAPQSDRALRPGDLVRIDVGASFKGYHADLGRTAVLGEPSPRQVALHDALQQGLDAALDVLRPGARGAAVFAAAIQAVRAAGLPAYGRHHVGYAIGLDPFEPPLLAPGVEETLETGMVLRVETPYYEPGWGGLHVKDTVLVTRGDHHVMNRSVRGLVVLD
jgi:Xaa-Pro aminopeptidase